LAILELVDLHKALREERIRRIAHGFSCVSASEKSPIIGQQALEILRYDAFEDKITCPSLLLQVVS